MMMPDLRPVVYLAMVGAVVCVAAWLFIPGPVLGFAFWLFAPRFGWHGDPVTVAEWASGGWFAFNAALLLGEQIRSKLRERRDRKRHAEFMALRAQFYPSNAVCLETLEQLRARALSSAILNEAKRSPGITNKSSLPERVN